MPRRRNGQSVPPMPKRPHPLPPKRVPRPVLKPQPRVMPKQHRGGR
jgi:hypothetical protein